VSNVTPIDRRTRAARRAREEPPPRETRGKKCKICSAFEKELPNAAVLREHVDTWYSRGFSPAKIEERIQTLVGDWPSRDRPARDSIERHTRNHVIDSIRMGREMAILRMRQFGEVEELLAEQFVEPIVDTSFIMVNAARDAITSGRIRPRDISDVIKALDAWDKFKPPMESEGITEDEHNADMAAIVEIARHHMQPAQYREFLADLKAAGR